MDENNYGKDIGLNVTLVDKTSDETPKTAVQKSLLDDFKSFTKDTFLKGFKSITTDLLNGITSTFKDAWTELKEITKFSTMTDDSVRSLKLGYGFSSSQAYGYSQALNATGMSSMEDLMWANSTQLEQFRKAFDKYSEYYEQTITDDFVEKQIEFQSEMMMFKQDLTNEVIGFYMDNKDTIITCMDSLITFSEYTIKALGWIVKYFGGNDRSQEIKIRDTQSIISSYTKSNTTNNINTTNNFNNVDSSDKTWLTNSVQLAYKQQIAALNQG